MEQITMELAMGTTAPHHRSRKPDLRRPSRPYHCGFTSSDWIRRQLNVPGLHLHGNLLDPPPLANCPVRTSFHLAHPHIPARSPCWNDHLQPRRLSILTEQQIEALLPTRGRY